MISLRDMATPLTCPPPLWCPTHSPGCHSLQIHSLPPYGAPLSQTTDMLSSLDSSVLTYFQDQNWEAGHLC